MEADGHGSKFTVCIYEAMGTALFLYCILASNGNAFAVIMGLFASIMIFGGVTGGHFNPAVTIGVYTARGQYGKDLIFMIMIIMFQLVGAVGGAALAWLVLKNLEGKIDDGNLGTVGPMNPVTTAPDGKGGEGFSFDVQETYTQIMLTFVFVAVICVIKDVKNRGTNNDFLNNILQAFAVVLTLYGCIQAAGAHTGAGFNPAVSFGNWLLSIMMFENTNNYLTHYLYAYTAGPAIGGLFAGLFYNMYSKLYVNNPIGDKVYSNIQ